MAMSRIRQYYEKELSALREQGKLFSERFPKLAPFLGQGIKDPDIERLLEGFAFVGAKLSAKIDDAFPELSEQFLEILAPGYFCIMPSASILQFKPNPVMSKGSRFLPRGTEVRGNCQSEDFLLTTCYDLAIEPLEIISFSKTIKQGQTYLKLGFKTLYERTSHDLEKPLRFYLQGDLRESYFLAYLLTHQLQGLVVHIGKEKYALNNKVQFNRIGMRPEESLIPFYTEYYHSFSLLAEYFSFPEKFMFLELAGFHFKELPATKTFELEMILDFDDRTNIPVNQDSFQLHSVPAVNLFKANAEPLTHKGSKVKYPLRVQELRNTAVHSILKVEGFSEEQRVQFEYLPARQFPVLEKTIHRYQSHMQESLLHDHPDISLELWSPEHVLETQIISSQVLAYQPEAFLKVNGIKVLFAEKAALGLEFSNLVPFTMPVYPPLSVEMVWQLIAHLAFKFKNLNDIHILQQMILAYDFSGFLPGRHHALGKKLVNHLLAVDTIPHQHFYRGEIFYGSSSTLTLKEDGFLNIGEIQVFGSILAEILKEHAPFNSYHELCIKGALTGIVLSWPAAFS